MIFTEFKEPEAFTSYLLVPLMSILQYYGNNGAPWRVPLFATTRVMSGNPGQSVNNEFCTGLYGEYIFYYPGTLGDILQADIIMHW